VSAFFYTLAHGRLTRPHYYFLLAVLLIVGWIAWNGTVGQSSRQERDVRSLVCHASTDVLTALKYCDH
jgi:hypothetical protein